MPSFWERLNGIWHSLIHSDMQIYFGRPLNGFNKAEVRGTQGIILLRPFLQKPAFPVPILLMGIGIMDGQEQQGTHTQDQHIRPSHVASLFLLAADGKVHSKFVPTRALIHPLALTANLCFGR